MEYQLNNVYAISCMYRAQLSIEHEQCQQNFNFLPIESPTESQLEIRTAKFLQVFSATEYIVLVVQTACSHAA